MAAEANRLNEKVIRIVSGFVVIFSCIILFTHQAWLALYLAADFFCRAFTNFRPPLARIGWVLANFFKLEPKWIYAPPKKFAASVGFVLSTAVFISLLAGFTLVAGIIGGILVFCSVLESVFGICVGCYVYDWLVVPLRNRLGQIQ